jgi:hypothetical protein
MDRRNLLRMFGALACPGSLLACGGGGSANAPPPASPSITSFNCDQKEYFVGLPPPLLRFSKVAQAV